MAANSGNVWRKGKHKLVYLVAFGHNTVQTIYISSQIGSFPHVEGSKTIKIEINKGYPPFQPKSDGKPISVRLAPTFIQR